jgi:hypothetical protein
MHTPRLIAVRTELNEALKKVKEVTFSAAEDCLYINQKKLPLNAPALKDPAFVKRWALARILLNEPVLNEEKLVASACIEQIIETQVDRALIKQGFVRWTCWGKARSLDLKEAPAELWLVAAKALQEGYVLKEAVGSHFWVTAPSGLQHVTTFRECNCVEFSRRHECVHHQLVLAAQAKRSLFLQHQLIEQCFL